MSDIYGHEAQNSNYTHQTPNNPAWKTHVTAIHTWQRALFMMVFLVIYFLLRFAVAAIALFQLGSLLLLGHVNERLQGFAQSLCTYSYQVASFVTFTSDDKPFPFSSWPQD